MLLNRFEMEIHTSANYALFIYEFLTPPALGRALTRHPRRARGRDPMIDLVHGPE